MPNLTSLHRSTDWGSLSSGSSDTSRGRSSILNNMTKREVVEVVALNTERAKVDVEKVLDSVLEVIVGALHADERVDLRGFGSFAVKAKKARQGRNPRTGATITIAAKRDASFKASSDLFKTLNEGLTSTKASSSD
jgi:nucleoid DNA-binding protein